MTNGKAIEIETASDRVVCRWSKKLFSNCNPVDEEVLLRVFSSDQRECVAFEVEHLSQKEIHLNPGHYTLDLSRFFKPEIEIRTPISPTPSVSWISDSPASHLMSWSGFNWDDIRREVERIHRLDWDTQAAVALRVLREEEGKLRNEWILVPLKDHCTVDGRIQEVELAVVRPENYHLLKSLFLAKPCERKPLQVYAREQFSVSAPTPVVHLSREIIETDTLQARAEWAHLGKGKLDLLLFKDGKQIEKVGPVGPDGDWLFCQLQPGEYSVRLQQRKTKPATNFASPPITLHPAETRCRLLPITENRGFCYWHTGPEVFADLEKEFGQLEGRIACFLQLARQRGRDIVPIPELTRPIVLGSTSNYYLDLAPDLVYRARLLARIDGEHRRPLTEWSNACQLARNHAGTNPMSHKRESQPADHPTLRRLNGPTGTHHYSWGYLLLHLHAHLPYIADPINFGDTSSAWSPMGYPQEWYPEAVCDTYLPLLGTFERLVSEGVDFKLSMDISPSLLAMMRSQRHASDVLSFLERLIKKAMLEVERTGREEPHYKAAAILHLNRYRRCRELFLGLDGDLVAGFSRLQELGHLELSTCVGTHPMLPLWTSEPSAIRGHCLAAAQFHESCFGRPAQGIWLPECAYTPGIEPFLEEAGFRYTFGEGHCITRGDSPAEFQVNAPVYARNSRICIFPRDPETGRQVWSGEEGYPGDPDYLEFHIRGGPFKYNRITDRQGGHKEPYNPDWADHKAASHAGHFMDCRNARFDYLRSTMWKKPLIVAPYDAELFGHHWYEGPRFLYYLFKKLHFDQNRTELTTPSAYLAANPTLQDMYCNVSSWGHQGTFVKWMCGDTSWMYRHGHEAAHLLGKLVQNGIDSDLQKRVLAQAARQLMVATSSDLPFVISNGHFVDRMKEQFCGNLRGFYDLCEDYRRLLNGGQIDHQRLRSLELENNLFPDLDPKWFGASTS
jgi:1,4-alpha-glucan branching enzyme